jgi:hypothetical protein
LTATRDLRLSRYPLPASLEEYRHAAEELDSKLRELPGLVALYGAGTVSAPGISDLDRIAVVDGHRPVPSIWERLSDRTRYLAMHTPFLVDATTFKRHRWFAHLEPLELLHGTEVALESPPDPGYARRLAGAESLVIMVLHLVKQIWTAQVKVRPLLCELHSMRHGLTLGGLGRDRAPGAWAVADEVGAVRDAWFRRPECRSGSDAIDDLVRRSLPAVIDALDALAESPQLEAVDTEPALRLQRPWSNVTLLPARRTVTPACRGPRLIRREAARLPRVAELWWRSRRANVELPAPVLALLVGEDGAEHAEYRAERARLVRVHRRFVESQGVGYSTMGFASPFCTP